MSFGVEVKNKNDKVIFSTDSLPSFIVESGSITLSTPITIGGTYYGTYGAELPINALNYAVQPPGYLVSVKTKPILYVSVPVGSSLLNCYLSPHYTNTVSNATYYYLLVAGAPITVKWFTVLQIEDLNTYAIKNTKDYGINVWNSLGKLIFDGAFPMLNILQFVKTNSITAISGITITGFKNNLIPDADLYIQAEHLGGFDQYYPYQRSIGAYRSAEHSYQVIANTTYGNYIDNNPINVNISPPYYDYAVARF